MILVFILSIVITLIFLLWYALILSTLRISILNVNVSNYEKDKKKIANKEKYEKKKKEIKKIKKRINNKDTDKDTYRIILSLHLFNKIKWLKFNLNSKRTRKIYNSKRLQKIDFKKLEKDLKLEDLKIIARLQPKISLLNLELKIGTEDVILTSFIIFFVTTAISIILPRSIKKYKEEKYKYVIQPVYMNKNLYKIQLDCIIEVKIVHIINIIYTFVTKKRGEKNERTSNRRSYGYSYE